MQSGDKGWPSIILAGQDILMKMLTTLELRGKCILMHFNIIETQVCKTVTRLRLEKCRYEYFFHKSQETLRQKTPKRY